MQIIECFCVCYVIHIDSSNFLLVEMTYMSIVIFLEILIICCSKTPNYQYSLVFVVCNMDL